MEAIRGSVTEELAAELPGIGILWVPVEGAARPDSLGLQLELDHAADRITGATAVLATTEPIAAHYRALRAQLGMDPDSGSGTLESIVRRRLLEGGFRPAGIPGDALALATLETGVPLWALALEPVEAEAGELAAGPALSLDVDKQTGAVSIFNGELPVCVLFGEPVAEAVVSKKCRSYVVVALVAPGVLAEVCALALERAAELCQSP
ncbi:MAG: hypothetical protein F2799_02670 [Actinobacteria bacterium]|uniref:Unannotated protein n=1 Tax=freshwater metagenome TaxID=449393 RepID=A0A6J7DF25_9ZZZZ|nr:hypothetical protein [Actinomycetota bacterium]